MATGTVVDVVMPQMGVSVSEGTITRWAKQVGERIEADETIVEISTDKVDTEVPSPASGVVREILANEGDTVPVNTRIAVIDTAGDAASGAPAEPADAPEPEALAEETPDAAPAPPAPPPAAAPAAPAATNGEGDASGRAFVSPVVARMLAEHSLSVDHLDRGDAGLEGGRRRPAVALERELHIFCGHRLAVVELDAFAQHELVHEAVTRDAPRFSKARRHGLARHRLHQRIVHGVEHDERHGGRCGFGGIEPDRRERHLKREGHLTLRRRNGGRNVYHRQQNDETREEASHRVTPQILNAV